VHFTTVARRWNPRWGKRTLSYGHSSPSYRRTAARLFIEARVSGCSSPEHPPPCGQGLLVQLAGAVEVTQVQAGRGQVQVNV
jgi:hypothetical protein